MTGFIKKTLPLLAFAILLFSEMPLLAQFEDTEATIPPLTDRVVDVTGTLSGTQKQFLSRKLANLEKQKGSQLVVVIVPTTGYDSIEEYTIRLAEKWKIGRKNVDDGVILLIAKNDRKLRIEVGYGLEGAIPDARAKQVISDIIVPYFKQGKYFHGIDSGVDAIITLINGEYLPAAPVSTPSRTTSRNSRSGKSLPFIFIGFLILGMLLRAILGGFVGGSAVGVLGFIVGWSSIGFAVGLFLGIGLFILTLTGLSNAIFMGILMSRGGGGGFSSGGSFGGGGFSGGGGSFGGGGASGNW